jgi:hypothetical protein
VIDVADEPKRAESSTRPSFWTWDTIKWLVGAALIPATAGWISHMYDETSRRHQTQDARVRLYTELLSKREEADSRVRQDMFGKMLETFQPGKQRTLEDQVVALELLALNFSEALNLSPLFRQIEERIRRDERSAATRRALMDKLNRVATVVKDKQIEVLEVAGYKAENTIYVDDLAKGEPITIFKAPVKFKSSAATGESGKGEDKVYERGFKVDVLERDSERNRYLVRVGLSAYDAALPQRNQWVFWVDPYDFPQVDFTRLSSEERFALVQYRSDDTSVTLTFIFFPSARGGVKDKPYMDEVVTRLIAPQTSSKEWWRP